MARERRMRILIDGMNLSLEQGTGVATYARNLAACIRSSGHELSILYGRDIPAKAEPVAREAMFMEMGRMPRRSHQRWLRDLIAGLRPVRAVEVPTTGLVAREVMRGRVPDCDHVLNHGNLFLTAQAKFRLGLGMLEVTTPEPVDIAHWTYPLPLYLRNARNVYTMHDLVPLKFPYATLDNKLQYHALLREIARRADAIVTVSETSRQDIIEILDAPPHQVRNCSQICAAPADALSDSAEDVALKVSAVADLIGAPGALSPDGYYLFVGAIEPKKNLSRVIAAYLASGVPEPLVIVGRRGWQYEADMRAIERSPKIYYTDYLPAAQVAALIRAARALVLASLYEGFGLPVVEAFALGAPVITSSVGATAEIAGDAALLVDPWDERAITAAFRRLSAPGSDVLRADLGRRGLERAKAFGADAVAPLLADLYRDVMAGTVVGGSTAPLRAHKAA
jgi:glycosyltransferase involved in cell wall biosynthesis